MRQHAWPAELRQHWNLRLHLGVCRDRGVEGRLSRGKEGNRRCGHRPGRDAFRVIADPARFRENAYINLHDITLEELSRSPDSMDDFLVEGDADVPGEPLVTEKGALTGATRHEVGSCAVDLAGGDAGSDQIAGEAKNFGSDRTGFAETVQLTAAAKLDLGLAFGHERREEPGESS